MSKDKRFRPISFFTNIAIALLALGSVVGIQSIGKQTKATLTPQRLEEQERLRLEAIDRLPTFGYDNLLASWVFLQYIQYFGDDVRNERGYALNLPYFDAITRLDPRFVEVYPMISIGVSLYMGKPEEAIALMERGTQALSSTFEPKTYIVWRFKGLDRLLFLGDVPGSIASHQKAIEALQGTEYERFTDRFREFIQLLEADPDSRFVRYTAWLEVYSYATDDATRQRAIEEILRVGGKVLQGEDGELYFEPPPQE